MSSKKAVDLLRHAAKRATQYPFFLAADLEQFHVNRGMQDADLARFLGCPLDALPKVALCRRPDPQTLRFSQDVLRIAETFSLQADRLVQLIREVDVLKTFGQATLSAAEGGSQSFLMAAREHETDEPAEEEGATHEQPNNGPEEAKHD